MKNVFLSCCILLIVVSCRNTMDGRLTEPISADTLRWILGGWQSGSGEGIYFEHWQRQNHTFYTGTAFMIRGTDTLFSESLEIKMVDDTLFYIPVVSGQNEGQPVKFMLKEVSGNKVVFQNLQHDFPQQITYHANQADSLHAWIDGTDKGKYRREDFRLVRVKVAPGIQVE